MIEIGFQNVDGTVYISGVPGRRDWYANLLANPEFTFHLKQSVSADLPARARPITDRSERRAVLTPFTANWDFAQNLDVWVAASPWWRSPSTTPEDGVVLSQYWN